jgi:S-disulfanyl-L-cysteine oxidoreductase SoxD
MSMYNALAAGLLLTLCAGVAGRANNEGFGQPIEEADVAAWDVSIGPDGVGLPPGGGTARQGAVVYSQKCVACHGEKGAGRPNDRLVGGPLPVKTVGSYWPYATTLFDFVRRAMPWTAPKSLTNDEVYSVSAYILALNGIIGEDDEMNAMTLPKVAMPNRNGFISLYPAKH